MAETSVSIDESQSSKQKNPIITRNVHYSPSIPPYRDSYNYNDDSRGVNKHTYSPAQMQHILDQFQNSPSQPPSEQENDDLSGVPFHLKVREKNRGLIDPFAYVHPSNYHRYIVELEKRKRTMGSTSVSGTIFPVSLTPPSLLKFHESPQSNHNQRDSVHLRGVGSILASTKRWLQNLSERRRKESLEREVEEQRQILLKQSDRLRDEARRAQYGDHYVNEEETIRNRVEKKLAMSAQGLVGNATFQNIMQNKRIFSGYGRFCSFDKESFNENDNSEYQNEDSQDYIEKKKSDGIIHQDKEENGSQERRIKDNEFKSIFSEKKVIKICKTILVDDFHITEEKVINNSDINTIMSRNSKDFIKISTPNETFSGQGMSVQVEIVEPLDKSTTEDTIADVVVEQEPNCSVPFILQKKHMKTIVANGLPASIMLSKWKRLYGLHRDGDSFEGAFLRKVRGESRTLLVIKTTRGEIMGGYADSPWESQGRSIGATFHGSAQACLFSIDNKGEGGGNVRVYKWTGANRYIQICDTNAKMLAFGGGGKAGEFGLCVEDDFRTGSTGTCDTFANDPLCCQDRFDIMDVECWGFVSGFC